MIGEIYVTINDLREENKLLRKERRELINEFEILESKWKRRQEKEDWLTIEMIRKDCMLTRIQGNVEVIEKSYLEKCHELQRNKEEHLELTEHLRVALKEEKVKRRDLYPQFSLLKVNLNSESESSAQQAIQQSQVQEPNKESIDELLEQNISHTNRTSDASIEACLPPFISQEAPIALTQAIQIPSSAAEIATSESLIRLMSEKNYWKNQTFSLRKEVMTLSNHLASGYRYSPDQGASDLSLTLDLSASVSLVLFPIRASRL
jgi:hypothetical protein